MVDLATIGISALVIMLAIFFVAVFPLYFLVKVFGGRTSIGKAVLIKIVTAAIGLGVLFGTRSLGSIALAILFIVIYMVAFRLGIIRAFLVWILEGFVIAFMFFLMAAVGIASVFPEIKALTGLF